METEGLGLGQAYVDQRILVSNRKRTEGQMEHGKLDVAIAGSNSTFRLHNSNKPSPDGL